MTDRRSRTRTRRRNSGVPPQGVDDGGLDPFEPGAVEIREPLLPTVPPPPRPVNLLVATVVICAAIVVSIGVFGRWTTRVAGYTAAGLGAWTYLLGEVRRAGRGSQVRAAGMVFLVAIGLAVPAFAVLYGPTATILGAAVFAVGAFAWHTDTRARAAVRQAEEERAGLTVAHAGAIAWNSVREALQAPDVHVEQNLGAPNFDEQLRIRAVDPATGVTALRTLDAPLARDGWLVVDGDGGVVVTAPPGAPDHWRRATAPSWPTASP